MGSTAVTRHQPHRITCRIGDQLSVWRGSKVENICSTFSELFGFTIDFGAVKLYTAVLIPI